MGENKESQSLEEKLQDCLKNDRFIRWQKINIEQFGYTHNLVLVIVIVFLGYLIETLKSNDIIKYKIFLLFCFI
ncbi:hypothetical protein L6249_00570 [Candidatus Parcubacteria bacterium]|nr:hypothetical protein [Patescibacteria group bacterium]MCG2690550.1 hypothetical protein [Candidatus Parcubacteria bacterium]